MARHQRISAESEGIDILNLPLRVLNKNKLSAAAASVTWTLSDYTIPTGTRHLAVIWNGAKTATADMALLRFNGDSGANYNDQRLSGASATASAARATGGTSIQLGQAPTGANLFGGGMILIPHYANTANHKAVLAIGGEVENRIDVVAGRWANTGAITSITILTSSSTFVANSIFILCAVDERYLVEESNLSADGTVTFSSIPQTPGDLVVVGYCRSDRATYVRDAIRQEINGDVTDSNYAHQRLEGLGTATLAAATAARSLGEVDTIPAATAVANAFGAVIVSINQHANAAKQPHFLAILGFHESSTPDSIVCIISGRRANIAAITSLKYLPYNGTNFKSGSLFSLYHVPKRLVAYKKLTADAASITHTVPSGYEVLVETVFARGDDASDSAGGVLAAFNNDTTAANYNAQRLYGDGSTVAADSLTASRRISEMPRGGSPANVFGGGVALIPAYAETDRHKHVLSINGVGSTTPWVSTLSVRWINTAAITEIDLTPQSSANFKGN